MSSSPPFLHRPPSSASLQGPSRGMTRSQIPKAPIVNPYEKFTQPQFDAWIGDLRSLLTGALDFRATTPPRPRPKRQWHVPRRSPTLEDEEQSVDEDESVARESAKAKGKGRDPREGPGLGGGDRETPIEILDSDDEQEEEEEEAEEWDSEFSSEEEAEEEEDALLNGESTARANARFRKYAARNGDFASDDDEEAPENAAVVSDDEQEEPREERPAYVEEEYGDETGSESESDGGNGSSPPREFVNRETYDELDEDQDMEAEEPEVFTVDSDEDEPQAAPADLDDDILPASSSIQTSPVEPLAQTFPSASQSMEVYTIDDEEDGDHHDGLFSDGVDARPHEQEWDWNNPPAFSHGAPTSASGHLATPPVESEGDHLFEEVVHGVDATDNMIPVLSGDAELEELFREPVYVDSAVAGPSGTSELDEFFQEPVDDPVDVDAEDPVIPEELELQELFQESGDDTQPPVDEEEPLRSAAEESEAVLEVVETSTEVPPVVEEEQRATSLARETSPEEPAPPILAQSSEDPVAASTPEIDAPVQDIQVTEVLQDAPQDSTPVDEQQVAPEIIDSYEDRRPLFPADDDDDDGEPFLYEEQFESDGFYGGPQYYVTEADDVEDEHDPGHFDARTMSRSVSIDPQHQHFIVEETPTEYEPEQRGMSIDIVALDEHLEPIEEEPLHVVKEDSPRSQSPAVTNVQDVEVRADEPRLSPSWSPSLPANVPMPILADATAVDPYQPSEPSILSSTRPGLMSFLRAKQESSLFTPDGSTGGTPPALEADAEAEPDGLTQTTLVDTVAESIDPTPPSQSLSDNTVFLEQAKADDSVTNGTTHPEHEHAPVASPMKMSLSLDTSSHRRTPVLQSDPYPYSLSTPGEAADPLEGQGMSDSAPSTADKDLGEQTETDGSGEDPTSAVTSFDNDPQNGDFEPDASETVETSKLDGAGPVEEQVEEPRSGPASEYEVVEIPDDVEGSDTDADGEDELVDDVSSNEVHTDPSIIVEDISANENEVQDGPSIPADVVPSQEEEADRPDGELQENGDVVPVEPEVATVSAKSADIADVFTESTKESTQRRETTAMKPVENDIDVLPSPSTESESGSLKRKREETQDDTSSTRSNFGKMARSRLSRKGKEKAAEDDASSTSSASSAVRLLNSVVGTPSDESSSFIQNSSPTHPRGNVIRVVRSLPKVEVAPPPPPPPPPLPPVLMHAHSHKRAAAAARQNTQPRPLPQRTPSTARVRTASPAASEHTPAPSRKPAPAPAATGTPVTRAHCRYHKVSIPENGDDEDEEDAEPGPRVFFVVPGCSLTDTKLMKEEDIKDEGDATTADGERMIANIEALDLNPYLIGVVRHLVGLDIVREHEVFYLPPAGQEIVVPEQQQAAPQPLKREKTKMRGSMTGLDGPLSPALSTSSRPPPSIAGSSSTASITASRRKKGKRASPAPSHIFSQGDDSENDSPAAKSIRAAELEGIQAAASNSPLRTRRSRRMQPDAAAYNPDADKSEEEEADEPKKKKRGVKRRRQSEAVTAQDEDRKNKKLKTRESIGPASQSSM